MCAYVNYVQTIAPHIVHVRNTLGCLKYVSREGVLLALYASAPEYYKKKKIIINAFIC